MLVQMVEYICRTKVYRVHHNKFLTHFQFSIYSYNKIELLPILKYLTHQNISTDLSISKK